MTKRPSLDVKKSDATQDEDNISQLNKLPIYQSTIAKEQGTAPFAKKNLVSNDTGK